MCVPITALAQISDLNFDWTVQFRADNSEKQTAQTNHTYSEQLTFIDADADASIRSNRHTNKCAYLWYLYNCVNKLYTFSQNCFRVRLISNFDLICFRKRIWLVNRSNFNETTKRIFIASLSCDFNTLHSNETLFKIQLLISTWLELFNTVWSVGCIEISSL